MKLRFFRVNDPIRIAKYECWFYYIKICAISKSFENIKKLKGGNSFLFAPFKHLFLEACMDHADHTKFWLFSEPNFFHDENMHINMHVSQFVSPLPLRKGASQ